MSVNWTVEADAAAALRARGVETDLSNAALHVFAKAAVDEIAARFGSHLAILRTPAGGGRYVFVTPAITTIDSLTEAGIELTEGTDYRILGGGTYLERLDAGGWPGVWGGRIEILYDAAAPGDRYDRVVTDLVKLAITYEGSAKSTQAGDYSQAASLTPDAYQEEREQLIAELAPVGIGFA